MKDDVPERGGATLPVGSGMQKGVSGFDETLAGTSPPGPTTLPSLDPNREPEVELPAQISVAVKHTQAAAASVLAGLAAESAHDDTLAPALSAPATAASLPEVDTAHYTRLDEFARGGLGRIVRARDERTGRIVALKEMLGDPDELAARFVREARITANLQHPAIVPVYEIGRWPSGEPFFAMKLVIGESLQQVIAKTTTLDDRLARLETVIAVADALAYAHGKGIIHRDLKPANILVGRFGETVVIDWGLAKRIGGPAIGAPDVKGLADAQPASGPLPAVSGSKLPSVAFAAGATVAGSVLGTPSYMPPEQALGQEPDARSDVYAIGAMLYQLIGGVAPYTDTGVETIDQLLAKVEREPPTPVRKLEPSAPPDLVTITEKAMQRDRAARYPSAAELAADLRRFTTGQLVAAHRYSRRTLVRRWLRKNRAAVTVAAILLAALAAVAVISVRRIVAERDDANAQRDEVRKSLAIALDQKGLLAEQQQRWRDAALYYAEERTYVDSAAARANAGHAEARAIVPAVVHAGHGDAINAVAMSRDASRVVTVDSAGAARMWRRSDGSLLAEARRGEPLSAVAFAPAGDEVVAGTDHGVIVRYATKHGGALVEAGTLTGHTKRVWSLAYSPDGKWLASASEDGTVRLWSALDGSSRVLAAHASRVYSVDFSPDSTRLVSGGDDRKIIIWNVADGARLDEDGHKNGGVRVVRWNRTGTRVVSVGWDFQIRLRDTVNRQLISAWDDSRSLHAAAMTPDDRVIAVAGDTGELKLWDVSTRSVLTQLAVVGQTRGIAISSDGRWLVSAGTDKTPVVWDLTALPRLVDSGHAAAVYEVRFSSDGSRIVTVSDDRTIRVWSIDGRELQRIALGASLYCGAALLTPSGIIAGCDDTKLHRWGGDGRELPAIDSQHYLRRAALAGDGATAAFAHREGFVAVVDTASGKIVRSRDALHTTPIYGIDQAAGLIATAGLDNFVKVVRADDLSVVRELRIDTEDGVLASLIDPSGKYVVGGSQDGALDVYEIATGKRVAHAKAHTNAIWSLAWTRDGRAVYSGGEDGVIRVWDTATWQVVGELPGGTGDSVLAFALSPDNATIAAAMRSGTLTVWDLAARKPRYRLGGDIRNRGCDAEQRWVDDVHRKIVAAACSSQPTAYRDRIRNWTHQQIRAGEGVLITPFP